MFVGSQRGSQAIRGVLDVHGFTDLLSDRTIMNNRITNFNHLGDGSHSARTPVIPFDRPFLRVT